jgi:hypothetical protein
VNNWNVTKNELPYFITDLCQLHSVSSSFICCRFFDCAAFIHDDMLEGVVRLARMMLHYKYPKYLEDGFDALTSCPPVIYSSVASPLGVVQHICRQVRTKII